MLASIKENAKLFIFLILSAQVLCLQVCNFIACKQRLQKPMPQIPWNLTYRQLYSTMWVLGTEPGPLGTLDS